ncbi:hypothetical protein K470DRAFT_259489 [Piedraia hortae CBS 480.64]|uniref:DUF6987 domain-containing protein n=1 Tax=Piedraia hortae CBS 480.64 TaxID=1314780 RepID=A0A6A7BUF4_9PEZI|nr:hypothetical protein K470DRAFT_259489 [Piedraia hortae CBS 480.64]
MSSNSNQYTYYPFPSSPQPSSPSSSRKATPRKLHPNDTPMAPSPLSTKQAGGAPKTPTKLGKSSQPSTPKSGSAKKLSGTPNKAANTPKEQAKSVRGQADSAKDKAPGAKEQAQAQAQGAKDQTQDAKDQAQDRAQGAKDQAEGAKDQAQVKAQDAKNQANNNVQDAKEQAGDKAQEASGGTKETANKGRKQVQDSAKDVKGKAEDAQTHADDGQVSEMGQQVKDSLSKETPQPIKDEEDAVQGAAEDAQDQDGNNDENESADVADDAQTDTAEHEKDQQGGGLLNGAKGMANKASGLADKSSKEAQEKAGQAKAGAENAAQDAGDTAQEEVDDAGDKAAGAGEEAKDSAEDAKDQAQETADDAKNQANGTADDVKDQAEGTAEDAQDQAEETAEDAKDLVSDKMPMPEGMPIDLGVLKGLEVSPDGMVNDKDGNPIGKLAEGDAEDLEGYPIGDDGEILDDDGDLVGRVELLPDQIKKQLAEAKERGEEVPEDADEYVDQLQEDVDEEDLQLPGLDILVDLTCQGDGLIYDNDGNTVGKVVEGDPQELQNATLNDKGEFLDEDGNVVGRAAIHDDAAELVKQGVYEAAQEEEEGEDEEGEEGEQENKEEEEDQDDAEGIEDQLPGIEALEGKELNEAGEIVDDQGDILGYIQDEELKEKIEDGEIDPATLKVDDQGQVVDKDGNVLGKTELADGAAEKLAGGSMLDRRILDGRRVNKKGQVLDEDGEVIGELSEGELKDCTGKKINDQGEVLNKSGKVIGRVNVVRGEAAENAMKQLKAELGEDDESEQQMPGVETLEGYKVNKKGQVLNEDGEVIGELAGGELSDCAGKKINDKGEILDKDGNVLGHARTTVPEEGEEEEEEDSNLPPLYVLEGLTCNKTGKILDGDGNVVGEVVEGDAKKLARLGVKCDDQGQFWDNKGHVIGRAQTVEAEDSEEEPAFSGLKGLHVVDNGYVEDEGGNRVGYVTEGYAKKLIGRKVDEDGDILDKKGSTIGHAERFEEEEEAEAASLSFLQGKTVNKSGFVIGDEGIPVARLSEGNAKELVGKKLDDQGQIWNDQGKVVGRVELIPVEERDTKPEGPFAGHQEPHVVKDGWIEDKDGNRIGKLAEGDVKRLVGLSVDDDGDIVDKYGNVKGHAEPWEEPDEEVEDLSELRGCTINKSGNAVNENGRVVGRVSEGDAKKMVGKKVDEQGQVWDDSGKVIGKCELVHGEDTGPDGPFAGFEGLQIKRDGTIVTSGGDVVGKVVEGDIQKLMGHVPDADGDIVDGNGNVIGKAERWDKERRANPMSGRRINKEGEVRDEDGELIGRLTDGKLSQCVGQEIDDAGNVVDVDGNKIGEATLLENIEDDYEGPSEEELAEAAKREEERQIAEKMGQVCQDTLDKMQPICKQITEYIEKADSTPTEELDEDQLVSDVKPLIEEGGRILQECNGTLRGLDPDGHIAAQAKGRAGTKEATPEEFKLADTLKEITTSVVTTIDNAKKRLNNMPHAKKKLNPLWSLLTQPLFQILAAVGLLLAGVLGLVGQLLNGLGLGNLVNGLFGGLGIDKLFGFGGDKKNKNKRNPISSLPVVGGLLGGGSK